MEDQCMVICGEWQCGGGGTWDFIIEKKQMARVVSVFEGIRVKDLEGRVLREFHVDESAWMVMLSYWPPSSFELATGIKTPPVLITNDVSLRYFFKHFVVKGVMNLYATFVRRDHGGTGVDVDEAERGYVTPTTVKTKIQAGVGWSSKKAVNFSAVGCEAPLIDEDDVELVREVEKVEERINSGSKRRVDGDETEGSSDEEGLGGGVAEADDIDVRPKGYDKEFWTPLLANDYGGSNAVNVVFNEDEIVDAVVKKKGPRRYFCDTNSVFDDWVEVGGSSSGSQEPKWEDISKENPWKGGVSRDASVERGRQGSGRKLEDVDDEEFDIPPMFDDTEYDAAEIPDMDVDEGDGRIYVGKVFGNKVDCQIGLAIYAIKNQIQFKQTRTKIDSFVVQCPDEKCDWRVTAHEIRGCGYYEIRKAQLNHTCPIESRMGYKSRATSRVIAAVYKSKFGDPGKGPVPRELQRLVLEDLVVNASYMKCYRAKEKANFEIHGSDEESYTRLPEYLYMLKLANPDTITDLETELDDEGNERFLYLFVAFGASIKGFQKLRRVLVIDGTHLGGKYKGVLLTASGQDANFQIFPLAYAVVDAENVDAWTWFLQKVERILCDSASLSIISDRATSISTAVKRVYPSAKHGACIVHLARNVNSRFSSKKLAQMVTAAAMACRLREFRDMYGKIRALNSACGIYLGKIGAAHWSRSNFPGDRYNIMTSNIAEQLNKALKEGRSSPITEMVIFIQRMMTRWFSARRKKSERHRGLVSVEVDKEMTKNMAAVRGSQINSTTEWSSEIVGQLGGKEHVMLAERKCSCKYFDVMKIPCGHAMLAADGAGVPYDTLVGHWYKTGAWKETYAGVISPEGDPRDADIPEEVRDFKLFPPMMTKRPSGRRRQSRIPSTGEFPVTKKTKEVPNRCGRCRGIGHNRTNCTRPI